MSVYRALLFFRLVLTFVYFFLKSFNRQGFSPG